MLGSSNVYISWCCDGRHLSKRAHFSMSSVKKSSKYSERPIKAFIEDTVFWHKFVFHRWRRSPPSGKITPKRAHLHRWMSATDSRG